MFGPLLVSDPTDSYVARGTLPLFQHTLAGHLAALLWGAASGIFRSRARSKAARAGGAVLCDASLDNLPNFRALGGIPL